MNYAIVENGVVVNIIVLDESNAVDFPNAVSTNSLPVHIGDELIDGVYYRNGEVVLSIEGQLLRELRKANEAIAELDAALLDATYENIIGGLE